MHFLVWNAQSRKIKLNTLKQVNHQNVSNSNAVCSNKNKRLFDQPGYKNLLNLSVEGGRFYEYITLHLDKARHVKRYRQSVGANVSFAFCASPLRLTNECQSIYHSQSKVIFRNISRIYGLHYWYEKKEHMVVMFVDMAGISLLVFNSISHEWARRTGESKRSKRNSISSLARILFSFRQPEIALIWWVAGVKETSLREGRLRRDFF